MTGSSKDVTSEKEKKLRDTLQKNGWTDSDYKDFVRLMESVKQKPGE